MSLTDFIRCLLGPRLYRIHEHERLQGRYYQASPLESISDNFIRLLTISAHIGAYTSPLILFYLTKRGELPGNMTNESLRSLIRAAIGFGLALLSALCVRGVSRLKNNEYLNFISTLASSSQTTSAESSKRRYDFDFSSWPIDFNWTDSRYADSAKPPRPLSRTSTIRGAIVDKLTAIPCNLVSYFVAHSLGRWMIYPGSVGLWQALFSQALIDGRKLLIERQNGKRYKLLAQDGNEIDSMFIDRRNANETRGKTLIICCEGNAGFYESGIVVTPIHAGYSTLGWNHPGFGGSTGLPFPEQEVTAIDVVVKFAIDELGFEEKNILVMGWSIGGFTASWAAMTYPDIKGLILDATFDDIVPLALSKTPTWWKPLTIGTIKGYFDLNVSRHLENYPGPVLIIRRTQDEMIFTRDDDPLASNRANNILIKLFDKRFPVLMKDEKAREALQSWLTKGIESQRLLTRMHWSDSSYSLSLLKEFIDKGQNPEGQYPLNIGEDMNTDTKIKLLLFLASKHFKDFNATHCAPLTTEMFSEPWNLFTSVKTSSQL